MFFHVNKIHCCRNMILSLFLADYKIGKNMFKASPSGRNHDRHKDHISQASASTLCVHLLRMLRFASDALISHEAFSATSQQIFSSHAVHCYNLFQPCFSVQTLYLQCLGPIYALRGEFQSPRALCADVLSALEG